MTADLVDGVLRLLTDFRNANRAENASPQPYPDPVWRPGDPTEEEREKTAKKQAAQDRAWYQDLVAKVTPEHAEKG